MVFVNEGRVQGWIEREVRKESKGNPGNQRIIAATEATMNKSRKDQM
jgi:hypothetical protein